MSYLLLAMQAGTDAGFDPGFDFGSALLRMILVLGGVVVALLLAAKFLPRLLGVRTPEMKGKRIEIMESRRLEPRKSLYLVRVGKKELLLAATAERCEVIASGPFGASNAQIEAREGVEAESDFATRFSDVGHTDKMATVDAREARADGDAA